jgi:hypothetical protein
MPSTVDALYREALTLSHESRVALAERLIESIEPNASVVEAQMVIVRQRLNDLESGSAQPVSGPEGLRAVREAVAKRAGA